MLHPYRRDPWTNQTISNPSTSHSNGTTTESDDGECKLLGPFSLLIQGALGLLALLSLVYKRWRERPQRPVKVWAFDASKQVIGSGMLHILNLGMSLLSADEATSHAASLKANPCSFYLMNLAVDTTLGIPVLIFLLNLFTRALSYTPFGEPAASIESGNYGSPPKTIWWLKQCIIYFLGLLGMKLCVYGFFQLCPWVLQVGDWALGWTEGNATIQVFFVMLLFPMVMNAIQYYIIDSFIKDQKATEYASAPQEDWHSDEASALVETDLPSSSLLEQNVVADATASPGPRSSRESYRDSEGMDKGNEAKSTGISSPTDQVVARQDGQQGSER